MARHSVVEGLQPLEEQEGVHRSECGSEISEVIVAELGEVRVLAEIVPPAKVVVVRNRSVMFVNRPEPQSKVPASVTTPPREVP